MYSLLTQSRLFYGLTADEIQALCESVPYRKLDYKKHEVIFRAEELANHLGVILTGRILVSKIFESGKLIRITDKLPGEMFGEAACFAGSKIYPCELVAEEDTSILLLDSKDVIPLLQKDARVLENYLTELSNQAFLLNKKIEMFSYRGTDQKLAFFLLTQSQQRNALTVPVPGSIIKMASEMNVSRTTLHREIRSLERQGLIRYENKTFSILQVDALHRLLSHD